MKNFWFHWNHCELPLKAEISLVWTLTSSLKPPKRLWRRKTSLTTLTRALCLSWTSGQKPALGLAGSRVSDSRVGTNKKENAKIRQAWDPGKNGERVCDLILNAHFWFRLSNRRNVNHLDRYPVVYLSQSLRFFSLREAYTWGWCLTEKDALFSVTTATYLWLLFRPRKKIWILPATSSLEDAMDGRKHISTSETSGQNMFPYDRRRSRIADRRK